MWCKNNFVEYPRKNKNQSNYEKDSYIESMKHQTKKREAG